MSLGQARITKVVTNGPYTYTWLVDSVGQKAEVGLSAAQCMDAIKTLAANMTGTIVSVSIQVNTVEP